MQSPHVVIVVVAYEAESFIEGLLARIPSTIFGAEPLVLVSDDASTDATAERAERWAATNDGRSVKIHRQPTNLRYGGNQKASMTWAIDEGADVIVLLHGDEQYPPELIPDLVELLRSGDHHAAFGSRMIIPGGARAGGMPLMRLAGNRTLSWILNRAIGTTHTEWFSGFRAYRASALQAVGFDGLPDGFDFDVALTIRLLEHGYLCVETPIPTHYGDELSRVPLLRTGIATIRHALRARRAQRSAARPVG
jgi:glycosyltransferase involved in cell wall biosynthesis